MNRKIFALLIGLLSLGFVSVSAQPVLKFESTTHDFGKFSEEKPVTHVFVFTNEGDEPLVIQQAMTSCGCTVADYTKTPVNPGEKGKVTVTYDGKGKYPGSFKKSITVRSNASNTLVRLYIKGEMKGKE